MKTKKRVHVEPRNCENCGSSHLEFLWHNDFVTETRNNKWHFQIRNVICMDCGFVFVSPVPASYCMNEYYGDSYVKFTNQALDYTIENRIEFMKRNLKKNAVFVELGSNQKSEFHSEVKKMFKDSFAVELNDSVEKDYHSIEDIPRDFADMVAHYFVLEHIPQVRAFVEKCRDILKPDGVMIIEVPDIKMYPDDYSALILHEHLNHFSIETLGEMVCSEGFEFVETSHLLCSRPFGFAAAFKKAELKDRYSQNRLKVYQENKTAFLKGVEKVGQLQQKSSETYSELLKAGSTGKKAVLWGANNELLRFLNDKPVPDNAVVVDSNPLKKGFSDDFCVYQPQEVVKQILESERIILFSRLHSKAILKFIEKEYDKNFHEENILVLC